MRGSRRQLGAIDPGEPEVIWPHGRVVAQPGDGSCHFHAMAHVSGDARGAEFLRAEVCAYMEAHPHQVVAGDTIAQWIRYDSGRSVPDYVAHIRSGGWGGGLELAVVAEIRRRRIRVFGCVAPGAPLGPFRQLASFGRTHVDTPAVLLYGGGVHYDVLEPV